MLVRGTVVSMVLAMVSCGLGQDDEPCPRLPKKVFYYTGFAYEPNAVTPKGIAIDTSGQTVSLKAVDCIVDAVEACYRTKGPSHSAYLKGINRRCLKVKIAPVWRTRFGNADNQCFDCRRSEWDEDCRTDGTDCCCAGFVEGHDVMTVTPSLAALSHELTHVVQQAYDPFPREWEPCANGINASNCSLNLR